MEQRSTGEYNWVRVQPRYSRKRHLEKIWDKRSMDPDVINAGVGAMEGGKVSVISRGRVQFAPSVNQISLRIKIKKASQEKVKSTPGKICQELEEYQDWSPRRES